MNPDKAPALSREDRPLKVNPTGSYCVIPADLAAAEAVHRSMTSPHPLLSPLTNVPSANTFMNSANSEKAAPKEVLMVASASLVPCKDCGRRFSAHRVEAHQRICQKVSIGAKRRGVFSAQDRRQHLVADVNTSAPASSEPPLDAPSVVSKESDVQSS
jgi:hypothetical protein